MAGRACAAVSQRYRVGISGWRYAPWRKVFYPEDLAQRRELEYASRQVNTIEINGSFYSLQTPGSYGKWFEETPDDFVFAIKGGRFITHIKRLRDVETPLANFFASGLFALRHKLGPFLWQLPPSFRFDPELLERFFLQLPRDTKAAARLAEKHDSRVSGRSMVDTDRKRPLRHALEVRHPSFECVEFIQLMRKHGIALVVADTAGKWPFMEDVTADFMYLRLHGDEEIYASGYTPAALDRWAAKIKGWGRGGNPRGTACVAKPMKPLPGGRDVYVYFDNDIKVHAPFDAMALAERLGIRQVAGITCA